MIAVIGATGNTGRAVVKELQALGENPVCVVRNADKAREVLGPNAKVAVAELTDPAALERALQGVKSVFVVTGHNPQMTEQQINVQHAAEDLLERGVVGHVAIDRGARLRVLAAFGAAVDLEHEGAIAAGVGRNLAVR